MFEALLIIVVQESNPAIPRYYRKENEMKKSKPNIFMLKIATAESAMRIDSSAVYLGIYTTNYAKDPVCLIQLSLAILMDKPIYMIIQKGVKTPKKLIRMLDGYEFYDPDVEGSFEEASRRILKKWR